MYVYIYRYLMITLEFQKFFPFIILHIHIILSNSYFKQMN